MRSRSFRWIWLALAFSGCASPPRPPVVANQAAAVTRVIVRHALMTYVMDSPAGQRDKARAAVETSKLLEAITSRVGRHVEIEIRFDAAAGDEARTAQAFIRDARARIRGAEVSVKCATENRLSARASPARGGPQDNARRRAAFPRPQVAQP